MFSLAQRFQTVSNQVVTYACFIAAFVAITSWLQLAQNDAFSIPATINNIQPSINVRTSRYYGSQNGKPKQNSKIVFDIDADLSSLFNWNTKQIFVYLTAEYSGSEGRDTLNEVTYWDKIITSKDDAQLSLHNAKSKYSVWDLEEKFDGREANFQLKWNIQPWVGPLIYGQTEGNKTITFPVIEKTQKKVKQKVV
ncbi:signal peptidase complex subunit SPC3 TDEL_0C00440 [Torulaspora delbrueckii]|uniref:Signal peptidase subunit 3 n=1 Tax=Torulaspora delbrueckii TaxID=4950 RepID=G8ZQZ1_TORDE|nr:hypothetical protein TDEL_0C00440 [Torulaspora delbrueckii]CCE90933.1 hypothetical protein TDEL_0C00440 [Torulaspora delbrueckii]